MLREMSSTTIDGAVDLYARSLRELLQDYQNIRFGTTEWNDANDLAHLLIAELVAARHEASGNNFWRSYQTFTDSTVQAEALVALGELKVESRFTDVVWVVNTLNAKPNSTNRQNDENIAAGGFTALEKYGNQEGYLAAFIGSESWYREFVKQRARSAFNALLKDPAQLLPDIILPTQYSPIVKQRALEYVDSSSIDNSQKAEIASKALVQGSRTISSDPGVTQGLVDYRRAALQMIRKYGIDQATETYTALSRSLNTGNVYEKLDCIPALGSVKTPEAATIIYDYLRMLNDNRILANSQPIDDRLMRSLIPAMRESNDTRAQEIFRQTLSAPWSNTVLAMAQEALDGTR
ncbi:MAG: hypothetical protein LBK61_05220 [Spirochaetaceae bacterium]|nr:hypothetical protein [Spirochaetaceae bacterium]